jgi:alpha-mannosidase
MKATYEIPYGSLERPTHTNTSWDQERFEVAVQRWIDLSEPGFGLAVMNDGKYGCDVRANVIRLTLLRSPCYPEPDADLGVHEFVYSLMTHDGDWRKGEVVQRAAELNVPSHVFLTSPGTGALPPRGSLATVDAANVIVEAVKKAEDSDALVIRLYECHGARGHAVLSFGFPVASVHSANMLEETGEALEVSGGQVRLPVKPYEIRTLVAKVR